jgi:DNA-binding transcriptional ArsR family regulator
MHCHAMDKHQASSRNILACLGDPSRFRIVLSLLERERCVTELAAEVSLSQSCTTRHLQYLEREGLVRGDRQGKRVVFRLRSDRARVRELMAWVTAASPESLAGRVSGADVHVESAGAGTRARTRSRPAPRSRPAAPRRPARSPLPPSPPDLREDIGRAEADLPPSAHDGKEMEDWLL